MHTMVTENKSVAVWGPEWAKGVQAPEQIFGDYGYFYYLYHVCTCDKTYQTIYLKMKTDKQSHYSQAHRKLN